MKILWSETALERLEEIRECIAVDSHANADRFTKKILDRVGKLTRFPKRGRKVPELPRSGLREIIVGSYRIIYTIHGDVIQILTVFDAHYQKLFGDFE